MKSQGRISWLFAGASVVGLAAAAASRPAGTDSSGVAGDWSPFVFVTGPLVIGLVASGDGLLAAGHQLARAARSGGPLFAGMPPRGSE